MTEKTTQKIKLIGEINKEIKYYKELFETRNDYNHLGSVKLLRKARRILKTIPLTPNSVSYEEAAYDLDTVTIDYCDYKELGVGTTLKVAVRDNHAVVVKECMTVYDDLGMLSNKFKFAAKDPEYWKRITSYDEDTRYWENIASSFAPTETGRDRYASVYS